MTVGHDYFDSKWYTSVNAMTPLHCGAATSPLNGMVDNRIKLTLVGIVYIYIYIYLHIYK